MNDPIVNKKDEIIKKSAALFVERGYENATTRELAKAAGLTSAGLYHYFKSKKEILDTIYEVGWKKLEEI